MLGENLIWAAPEACTLPTEQQPLRVGEFALLFATALCKIERPAPTLLRLELDAAATATAQNLAARESSCCAFFTFTFTPAGPGAVCMNIEVPPAHIAVLDGLAAQATAAQPTTPSDS
ncbi:hypothetical protein OG874_08655 [Nocardia sp. NBC_00565]|uniref:hypothetical protein n=1 Tax=Nocardia sp. NBC_00565 TaxID=2975993 RepID=UPI002E81B739|nr:hypothetical protein [Nocardia sp. NBC_00565]WUC05200.1 hypothetical protein OG874_08655 [Nocardia sp. NBC_00565]